jgi:hypothetical protein
MPGIKCVAEEYVQTGFLNNPIYPDKFNHPGVIQHFPQLRHFLILSRQPLTAVFEKAAVNGSPPG